MLNPLQKDGNLNSKKRNGRESSLCSTISMQDDIAYDFFHEKSLDNTFGGWPINFIE